MLASRYGHTNIVQLLLEHDADVNLQAEVSSLYNVLPCVSTCISTCCVEYVVNYRTPSRGQRVIS